MGVTVHFLQSGLMHMLMGVLGAVGMGVGMFVLNVIMLVRRVGVRVADDAVLVFVRVGRVVVVLLGHRFLSFCVNCVASIHLAPLCRRPGDGADSPTAFRPASLR